MADINKITLPDGTIYNIKDNNAVDKITDQSIDGVKTFKETPYRSVLHNERYQEVAYIQGNGIPYINTGKPVHMSWRYRIDFQQSDNGQYRIWGTFNQQAYNGGLNTSLTYSVGWTFRWETTNGQTREASLNTPLDANRHVAEIINGKAYMDGLYKSTSAAHDSTVVSIYNAFLFTINPGGNSPTTTMKGKIYSYKVWDANGVLIQDMVPVYDIQTSKAGLYDRCDGTFYGNANSTGTFTYGSNLSDAALVSTDELATVATSGLYEDLDGRPTFATVATSGSYNDLTNKPIISNNAVTQTATTTNSNYEVLFSGTADNTTRTEGARKSSNLKFNPSTGNLQATQLNGVTIGSTPKFTDTTYTASNATPQALGTAAAGTSTEYSRADHVHAKPTKVSEFENDSGYVVGVTGTTYETMFDGEFTVTTATDANHQYPYANTNIVGRIDKRYAYRVTFDETEYILPCQLLSYEYGSPQVNLKVIEYLGNVSLYRLPMDGLLNVLQDVPFLVISDSEGAGTEKILLYTEEAGEHTVLVEKIVLDFSEIPATLIYGDEYRPFQSTHKSSTYEAFSVGSNMLTGDARYGYAFGYGNNIAYDGALVAGILNEASAHNATAIGRKNLASGTYSMATGRETKASGICALSAGYLTVASGAYSHAEGLSSIAGEIYSHAEGEGGRALARGSHVEGGGNHAPSSQVFTHIGGVNNATTSDTGKTVSITRYNEDGTVAGTASRTLGKYAEVIGNGDSDAARSNARILDWDGNEKLAGGLTLGMGTANETSISAAQLNTLLASGLPTPTGNDEGQTVYIKSGQWYKGYLPRVDYDRTQVIPIALNGVSMSTDVTIAEVEAGYSRTYEQSGETRTATFPSFADSSVTWAMIYAPPYQWVDGAKFELVPNTTSTDGILFQSLIQPLDALGMTGYVGYLSLDSQGNDMPYICNLYYWAALPPVTTSDNGKVLTVVNGAWAAANLPIYNGGVS